MNINLHYWASDFICLLHIKSILAHFCSQFVKMQNMSKLQKYVDRQLIGKGGFARVYRCKVEGSNCQVAMKIINLDLDNEGFPSVVLRQISLLREVNHQNIIKLKEVLIQHNRIHLIFQYVKYDLKDFISRLGPNEVISRKMMRKIMRGLVSGIAACHSKLFMHRDIKTSNILVDQAGNVKIADFGISRTVSATNPPYSEQTTTQWYRAPEVLLGSYNYSIPIDIWSLGCVFAEMALKRIIFSGNNDIDQLDQIFRVLGTPNERIWPNITKLKKYRPNFTVHQPVTLKKLINERLDEHGLDLLQKMLKLDPNARITAQQALLHPYLTIDQ